jgi:acetyl-CoA carboxylase carboxyltransferase component
MGYDGDSASRKARERVQQVSSHIAPTELSIDDTGQGTTRNRKKKATSTVGPPADYADRLGQIATLEKLARTPDINHRGYARQKKAGKLWVRERVEALLDDGTLEEIGSVTGEVTWSKEKGENGVDNEVITGYTPSNSVQGYGRLDGRKIVFTADDYTLRAGHADGALWEKTLYVEKLSLSLRLPIVKLVDGSSGGGSVTTIRKQGFSYIPPLPAFEQVVAQLNLGIPNLGAVLGPAIGLGAARVTACHFSVMAANVGSLFNAGPQVVNGATFEEGLTMAELGGPDSKLSSKLLGVL